MILGRIVLHWNGQRWAQFGDAIGSAIWGSGPSDVWLAEPFGQMLHFDGQRFTRERLPTDRVLRVLIGGGGPGRFWALGDGSSILRHEP